MIGNPARLRVVAGEQRVEDRPWKNGEPERWQSVQPPEPSAACAGDTSLEYL